MTIAVVTANFLPSLIEGFFSSYKFRVVEGVLRTQEEGKLVEVFHKVEIYSSQASLDYSTRSVFRPSSEDVDGFDYEVGSTRKRGRSTVEGLAQSVFTLTSYHALRWVGHLVENQEGLETKVGLRADLIDSRQIEAQ
ncbi:hypothetical protein M9H77_17583 [Catharanthus roseus]|uniref:Uncharacterized protein n=1 Tax=Catharanthus roseus TaxID=4058 RepID=A0ACC0B4Z2_CATRO|nr:hypothetical protein M9H77_17583 [Catharanthus roseus]